jgi:hypothetical protein
VHADAQLLQAIIDIVPDAPPVKSGDAQYVLAEVMLSFHEMKTALALYRAIESGHRDHPKMRDDRSDDSVPKRIKMCYDLMNKMGIESDGEKK